MQIQENFQNKNCSLMIMIFQASPEKKTWDIKSPCPFGCVGYLALAELLIGFYIWVFITPFDKYIDVIY